MVMNAARDPALLTALERLGPHDHLCSIYESPEEHFAVAMPFIRIGLERGEKCIYIADDGTEAAVRDAMHAEGIDVEQAIALESLVLENKEAAYLKHGLFDPEWMFKFWSEASAEAMRQGYSALRATGETEWVSRGAPGIERWIEYESRMTHMMARHNCIGLCQYNRQLMTPELVLDVIRTHPTVIYRGVVCRNMYYVPPDELLGTNQAAREVERLLTNIREREEVEFTLRQQRNELRESEARFREIAENIREVFWVLDLVTDRITFVSPMYEEMFGRSCASLYAAPRSYLDAIYIDDRSRVEAALLRSRGTGAPCDERYRVARADGSLRWIRARSFPVRDSTGSIKRLVGVAEDISEAQRALEEIRISNDALRESEQRWRSLFENSAIGMVVGDAAANILASNRAFQELVGYNGEELRKLSVYDLTYEADVPRNVELRAELLSGARPEMQMEKRLRCKDQRMLWVRVTSSLIPGFDGTPGCVVALVEDITNRKLAEVELQQSERLLRLVLDSLPVGVGVFDHSGDIILTNPAAQRIWNGTIHSGEVRYAESKGWWRSTGKKLAPDDWPSVRAFANGETTVNEVIEIEAFDGVRKILQTSAVPIRDNNNCVTGAVAVIEDISSRTMAERELSDSYHQMRTLTGRLMRAQDDERRRIARLLHETTAQDLAALKMHLARLNRTSDRLNVSERSALAESIALAEQSITEIRTLSYLLHPPFLDETGLLSALRWYAAGFAERSSIEMGLELPESFERLGLDTETALFRIVQESLINIHRHAGSKTACIRLQRDAEMLVLEIEDHGRGIPDASLKRIMSGGGGGVGVGIAGMSERIEQLGGRLEITSSERGTIVRARLPLARVDG
jgi:PAS domain S-box-containing protein